MYVPTRPTGLQIAAQAAHAQALLDAETERARLAKGWHYIGDAGEPGFQNGASGVAGYYKDSEGFVYLRGTVLVPAAVIAFTLPADMRPGSNWMFTDSTTTGTLRPLINPRPNGDVYIQPISAGVRLDGLRFRRV